MSFSIFSGIHSAKNDPNLTNINKSMNSNTKSSVASQSQSQLQSQTSIKRNQTPTKHQSLFGFRASFAMITKDAQPAFWK